MMARSIVPVVAFVTIYVKYKLYAVMFPLWYVSVVM